MFSLADSPLLVRAGTLALPGVAFLVFLAILGLRFVRRGAERFWTAAGVVALVLLPAVLAAGLTALAFKETLEGMALTGPGGAAAIAAGSAEALIPLLVGLASVAALAFVGLLLTSFGSSRVTQGSGGGLAWPLAALASTLLGAGLIGLTVQLIEAVHAGLRDPRALLLRLSACLVGSAGLATLLLSLALVTALRAPRGASSLGVKLTSLLTLSLCGLLALAGLWVVHGDLQRYTRTALTGEREDAWPVPGGAAVAEPEPPHAPPPPAPGPSRADGVSVGGEIKEPKKLTSVPPVYPEIAKQARVQGVVILKCTISPEGKVTRVQVVRGTPLLDQAAIDAVQQWVYTPTLLNGVAVPVIMTVTVNFRLSQLSPPPGSPR